MPNSSSVATKSTQSKRGSYFLDERPCESFDMQSKTSSINGCQNMSETNIGVAITAAAASTYTAIKTKGGIRKIFRDGLANLAETFVDALFGVMFWYAASDLAKEVILKYIHIEKTEALDLFLALFLGGAGMAISTALLSIIKNSPKDVSVTIRKRLGGKDESPE